jgi:hypothetical protein
MKSDANRFAASTVKIEISQFVACHFCYPPNRYSSIRSQRQ